MKERNNQCGKKKRQKAREEKGRQYKKGHSTSVNEETLPQCRASPAQSKSNQFTLARFLILR
jgi:hypothetical protein